MPKSNPNLINVAMDKVNRVGSCASYNMHGVNQGGSLVESWCEQSLYDFILLQEHWLSPANLDKINKLAAGYSCFSCSSMDEICMSGILRGRPFGGLAILVKQEHSQFCKLVFKSARVIAIRYNDTLIINIYFPCSTTKDSRDLLTELIGDLEEICSQTPCCNIIIGGDFNGDLDCNSWCTRYINEFVIRNKLHICDCSSANPTMNYTYIHETLGHCSRLDYFIVSSCLINKVVSAAITDFSMNSSDHIPIILEIDIIDGRTIPVVDNISSYHDNFRWDHADVISYYELTRIGLQSLLNNYADVLDSRPDNDIIRSCIENNISCRLSGQAEEANTQEFVRMESVINECYNQIVNILCGAADQTIPKVKVNTLKFWWDQELRALKQQSIQVDKDWKQAGCPRSGPIFLAYNNIKRTYKQKIREKKKEESVTITNELHDCLMQKNVSQFWKTWNCKINKKSYNLPSTVNNVFDKKDVAELFGEYFASNSVPSEPCNSTYKCKLLKDLSNKMYCDSLLLFDNASVEMIDCIVADMKRGVAADVHNISIEHIQKAHPIVILLFVKLFNCMIAYGIVPSAFGQGLCVPIPKVGSIQAAMSKEDFRGITISPTISKIFEKKNYIKIFSKNTLTAMNASLALRKVSVVHMQFFH